MIERDPDWSVYGVGIIQQGNVVRAMTELGLDLDEMLAGEVEPRMVWGNRPIMSSSLVHTPSREPMTTLKP